MSIFNAQQVSSWQPTATNRAGGKAYEIKDPRYAFASLLLTSFVKDQFYRSKNQELGELQSLLKLIDPLFAAKAAIFARKEFNMRSISHIVAGELIEELRGQNTTWARSFYSQIVQRPDDALEILAYYSAKTGQAKIRRIPNYVKAGFAKRLTQFDEYQLAKYKNESKQITLIDLVNLVRPKGTEAINKLMKGELVNTDTFEAKISKSGRTEKGKTKEEVEVIRSESWGDLIAGKKLGYTALLRNLRNISQDAPQFLGQALTALVNENFIKGSKVLPFQFYTAYEELQKEQSPHLRMILPALATACDIALKNVPELPGRTLIALDKSGSMKDRLKIASQFAAVLYKRNAADLVLFDDSARFLNPSPADPTLTLQQTILMNCRDMGSTDFGSVFRLASSVRDCSRKPLDYDRIIFITDDQSWSGPYQPAESYRKYCAETKTRPSVFLIDTAGLGTLSFPEDKVYAVAGFSEKIFDLIKNLEEDRNVLVSRIEAVII